MAEAYQIQKSRDGHTWTPMRPAVPSRPTGTHGLIQGGDHWFTDFEEAHIAATLLRNNLTWSEVRIVHRDENGTITREQTIL